MLNYRPNHLKRIYKYCIVASELEPFIKISLPFNPSATFWRMLSTRSLNLSQLSFFFPKPKAFYFLLTLTVVVVGVI